MRLNEQPPLLVPKATAARMSIQADVPDGVFDGGRGNKSLSLRSGAPAVAPGPIGPNVGAQSADEPTAVHIHIGRIEVTAVQEAPSPRASSGRNQAPRMSLDTYLAARSKT
jgi:hypothetical protein